MKRVWQIILSLLVMLATLFLVNCTGAPGCPQATFGSSACTTGSGGSGSFGGGGGGSGGSGGGGGGGQTIDASQAAALLYYGSNEIEGTGVTSAGAFGFLSSYTAPTLAANGADDMLIVNKKFLYIPMGDTTVVGYSINRQTGALTLIPGSPFTMPGNIGTADDVATDPLGQYLFVGSETVSAIWSFTINSSTGTLTTVAGSPFTTGFSTGGVADVMTVDSTGHFLYAGQLNASLGVAGFAIGSGTSGGVLTPLAGSPFLNATVAQIHASPTSPLLLGVQEVQDGTTAATDTHLYVYSIDSTTGALTEVNNSPFLTATGNAPFEFAISPNGNFVYAMEAVVTSSSVGTIEGFSLNSGTGQLVSLGTFSGVPTSEGCKFDQTGVFLFCIDLYAGGTTLTVNAANPSTGALTHVADLAAPSSYPFAVTD